MHTIRKDSSQRENPAFIEWSILSTLSSVDKMQNSVFSQNQSDLVICRKFGVCLHLHISFVIKTRANYVILVSFTLHKGKKNCRRFHNDFDAFESERVQVILLRTFENKFIAVLQLERISSKQMGTSCKRKIHTTRWITNSIDDKGWK